MQWVYSPSIGLFLRESISIISGQKERSVYGMSPQSHYTPEAIKVAVENDIVLF